MVQVLAPKDKDMELFRIYEEGKHGYGISFNIERFYGIRDVQPINSKLGGYTMSLFKSRKYRRGIFEEMDLTFEDLDKIIIKLQELRDKRK